MLISVTSRAVVDEAAAATVSSRATAIRPYSIEIGAAGVLQQMAEQQVVSVHGVSSEGDATRGVEALVRASVD